MKCPFEQLDPTSQDYLRQIEKTQGKDANGIFVPRGRSARPWGGLGFFFALVAAGIVVPLTLPARPYSAVRVGFQVGLSGLSALCLVWGIRVFRKRRHTPVPISRFTFVDGQQVWDVSQAEVKVTPIGDATDVSGRHRYMNGAYVDSTININFPSAIKSVVLNNQALAERLHGYVSALINLRRSAAGNEGFNDPVLLGAMATQILAGETHLNPENLDLTRRIPTPSQQEAVATAPGARRAVWLPWGVAAVVAGAAWLLFPLLNDYLSFHDARLESETKHNPGLLGRYLAQPANTLYRKEARALINAYYDEAIEKLEKRAAGKMVLPELSKGLLLLLKTLKDTEHRTITVGFRGKEDPLPVTEEQKENEKANYAKELAAEKQLRDLAERSAGKTAILPSGQTFDKEQSLRREGLILEQLRTAVKKLLEGDILTLEPAGPGEEAVLEVGYHTYAPGSFFVYTQGDQRFAGLPGTQKVVGLLRRYDSDWVITIRPSGQEAPIVCKLASTPANQLKYENAPGDPGWAPYAIILYSSFDNMGITLAGGFGLEAAKQRESYSYADAVGTKK